jgi:hypothetical protein
MPEAKPRFLNKFIDPKGEDETKPFTSERQLSAQAFNFHVERRDGRHAEGFGWSHYVTYRWMDEGEQESLVVVFSTRAVEILGHNLLVLVDEIRKGQLNGIHELATAKAALMQSSGDSGPVIASVKTYPDFEEILKEIKGEEDRSEARGGSGFTGRARG